MSQIPFHAVRAWLFEAALPFWAAHGVDRAHGGFLEELTPDGAPTACGFKRVRVICRQTYAFAHAAELGWNEGDALSRMGVDYLVKHARTGDGGWAKTLTRKGAVRDATADLYDIAFVLFALARRYRVSRDADVLALMHETLGFVQTRMRGPVAGFWHRLPPSEPRLQNPHMHLTEACLAAFEATQDQRYLDQARELVALFCAHLFDGATLGERFNDDWTRIGGQEGRAVEPGHHFEWAWILAQYQRLSGENVTSQAEALARFGETHGVDAKSAAVFDLIADDGAPLRTSSRTWTNTERIKAWLAIYELTGRDPTPEVSASLRLIFDRYFASARPGAWVDQFDADGKPMVEAVPASIVYHLFLAFAEVLRLEPRLKASAAQTP
jgi:mannose/cellobiose epimerase-like protein (N-acyl-D-glucosamine 2-epimerase family)